LPLCDELEELNVYTGRDHHRENPNAATEPINRHRVLRRLFQWVTLTDIRERFSRAP
jgi:hypothetical protein